MRNTPWQRQAVPGGLPLILTGVVVMLLGGLVIWSLFWLALWIFVILAPVGLVYAAVQAIRLRLRRRRAHKLGHEVVEVRRVARFD